MYQISIRPKHDLSAADKAAEFDDHCDMLTSLQLAVAFNKDKPNTAIRACCKVLFKRIQSHNIRLIIRGITMQADPLGSVLMLARTKREMLG